MSAAAPLLVIQYYGYQDAAAQELQSAVPTEY